MRSRWGHYIGVVVIALSLTVLGAAGDEPQVFSVSPGILPKVKQQLASKDKRLAAPFKQLIKDADAALRVKPVSVMEKTVVPASGDKHDYLSIGPYWWPDPSKSNGLPYIRRDGYFNPERRKAEYDNDRLDLVAEKSAALTLAYYFTDQRKYADHAARLLRVFFLNPATRMNPNLNHAQAIPGITSGRDIGMIEGIAFRQITDAVAILKGSPAWSAQDDQAMTRWLSDYLEWGLTSKNGKDERERKNNHGSAYDVQVAHLALHLGRTNLVREILETAKKKRFDAHLQPDGSQPEELVREDSFMYSVGNLRNFFWLATLGEHVGVDLWRYQTPGGAGNRKALEFILPYLESPRMKWPYERSKKPNREMLGMLLPQAYSVYGDKRYIAALRNCSDYKVSRNLLWYPIE